MSEVDDKKRHFSVRPDIAAMESYTPIQPFDILSEKLGRRVDDITKLDANENPYGPSPAVREAIATERWFHIYPDPESRRLREALSSYLKVPFERLLAGMGADELIDLVLRALIAPGDVVINCPPSFGMYPFSTAVNMGRLVEVPRRADFSLDVAGIESAVHENSRAKVLFLCSPNNPNGSLIDEEVLKALLALPIVVVLDEAYVDFAEAGGYQTKLPWTLDRENLIVLRTFSKLAGLAGLRVGYGLFPNWILKHLWKIKQPYNVNVAAAAAALAALQDTEWLLEKVRLIVDERERMVASLAPFDYLQPYPSHANFVLFRVEGRPAEQLKSDLAQEGVLVRYFNKPGLANCIRISAGRPEDTDALVAALRRMA